MFMLALKITSRPVVIVSALLFLRPGHSGYYKVHLFDAEAAVDIT